MLLTAAATITWTGGSATSANWSDPANWDLGRAPIDGDSLVFPATAQKFTNYDDVAGLAVNSITFQGTFLPGGYILRGDDLTVGSGGIADKSSISGTSGGLGNQLVMNVVLGADQNWSIDDSNYVHVLTAGNVANDGFTLSVTGTGIVDIAGPISGIGGLSVVGAPGGSLALQLTGTNTYTGPTEVDAATLEVNGSTAETSPVTVNPGGTLTGIGTVGGPITVMGAGDVRAAPGGALAPGAGVNPPGFGTLSNTAGVIFEPSAAVSPAQPLGVSSLPAFDVQWASNQLDSAGTVSIFAATLNLTTPGPRVIDGGQQSVIIRSGAPIVGTFNNLPEGSSISDGIQNFTISYANDRVTLTAQPAFAYLNGQAGDHTATTFVHNLYRELLGREPDAPGQAFWVNLFQQVSGTSGMAAAQQTVAADFLGSSEYHQRLVQGMYLEFLRRAADAGSLAFWTVEMAAGMDEKDVLAYIVGSNEYFDDAQPRILIATNPTMEAGAWVAALYRDLLGRTPDAGGASWTRQTVAMDDPVGRTAITLQFLGTAEAEQKLLNGEYPGAAGSVGAPGTPADGAYALANITGNGWDNLYFQGTLSVAVVDRLFAQLQAGESYGETIADMVEMSQYLG